MFGQLKISAPLVPANHFHTTHIQGKDFAGTRGGDGGGMIFLKMFSDFYIF